MKYLFVLTGLLLCACRSNTVNNNTADTTATKPAGFEVKPFAGVFYDTLPCADCSGIATQLYLKPDNSFIMEQNYLGKNLVYNIGRWSVTDSILKLNGNEGISQFKILNNATMRLLDNEGRMLYDTTNTHIILNRINTPFKPKQPMPIEGVFSAVDDTMQLFICAIGNSYPTALSPNALGLKAAYKSATHQKGEPVYAKLEGHFELRPALNDTTTRDFFVVEQFIKLFPGQQCK